MVPTFIYLGWTALIGKPARSLLLSVAIGFCIAAVSLTFGISEGFKRDLAEFSFGAYIRSIVVTENNVTVDQFGAPRLSDMHRISAELGALLDGAVAWRDALSTVQSGSVHFDVLIKGAIGDVETEIATELAAGRWLEESDFRSNNRLCMLGQRMFERVFEGSHPRHAIGREIRISGIDCEIVGILAQPQSRVSERYQDTIITPFDTAARYFQPSTTLAPNEVTQLTFILKRRDQLQSAINIAERELRRSHGVPLALASPFRFEDPTMSLRSIRAQQANLTALIVALTSITVLSGLVCFAGFYYATVQLRRRDIAIQITMGARRRDLFSQLLFECAFVGVVGAVIGAVVGLAIGLVMSANMGLTVVYNPTVFLGSAVVGTGFAIIAGITPISIAASTPPAKAMR